MYFENPNLLKKHCSLSKTLDIIDSKKINILFLWENKFFKEDKNDLNLLKYENTTILNPLDVLDKWIYSISKKLIINISKWSNFFNYYKIKIHFDPTEYGTDTIVKQIALNELDGCSIGKLRSYPPNLKGSFLGYYSNNVFFAWGKDSADRIKNSKNVIDNILISGFPYFIKDTNFINKIATLKKNFRNKGVKKIILILDTNHDDNKNSYFQYIPSQIIYLLYKNFINLMLKDKEIGLILKPKKNIVLDKLIKTKKIINQALLTKRCYLEEESFQFVPSHYASISDFTIGIGTFISSALIECAALGNRSIFYDYSHIFSHEKKLYNLGKNKIIFTDLIKIIESIVNYKNNPVKYDYLGDWSMFNNDLDFFRDNNGGKRVGEYIYNLKNFFDQGYNSNSSIKKSNELYFAKNYN